ncbi:potassium channel family protein [Photobacterium sp. TLY01]|uniref:potassium channel family protein n=1 Tax=Photobacterium sp. TLY01 TaxID=2907534 RepID=UPI001F37ED66|nr:potassium channel family protein [Photobacterium sp. TLY01]UIP30138.1 ion channel [Photobacterium sp. TLY01]
MLINIFLGLSVMFICLMFQSVLLVVSLSFYVSHHAWVESPRLGSRLLLLMSVMTLLLIGNLVQIGVWAWLFYGLDEFTDFATAYYFSCVNFATLGYGDIVMSERWRLLGPIESLNGIVMVGVSTSALLWTLQDTLRVMNQKNKPAESRGKS